MPNVIMACKSATAAASLGAQRAVVTLRKSAEWKVHGLMRTWLVEEISES
jgi:hypothetical protein